MVRKENIIIKTVTKNKYACFNCVNPNIDCEKIKLQVKPKFVKRMRRSLIKQENLSPFIRHMHDMIVNMKISSSCI